MKILFFTDLHMCPRASIVNKWGNKYHNRLENCIKSVNWLERKAEELNCDYVINLGDFFDKPDLNSETITACNEIEWSDIVHYSIVGNHDASISSLLFNSVNSFLGDKHIIVTEPQTLTLGNCDICFLPYIVECDRKPINEYFGELKNKHRIILSHNDISGIQLGPVVSRTGFSIEEIEANCDLFLNGHLHNGRALSDKIINLGNLTGKDFGEDAFEYIHNIAILDTDTMQLDFIENPHAYNFYKLHIENESDLNILTKLKPHAVVSIKCDNSLLELTKEKLAEVADKIAETRLILVRKYGTTTEPTELDLSVDHLARFVECCKASLENSNILDEELSEICK